MNYGYNSTSEGWKEDRKVELADKLEDLVKEKGHTEPYVEVDNLYPGVRIRKITNLSEADAKDLTIAADKVYEEVMIK